VRLLFQRGKNIKRILDTSKACLQELQETPGYGLTYFKEQWERQRQIQLSEIETPTEKDMREQVEALVELEDKLRETQSVKTCIILFIHLPLNFLPFECTRQDMNQLRHTRRRNRTEEEVQQLTQLPDTLVLLENEIEHLIETLGSDDFRNLPGGSGWYNFQQSLPKRRDFDLIYFCNLDPQTKALIKVKISKSKLYEAKVGLLETQRKWDQRGSGRLEKLKCCFH
jgi:hypothetical protein